MSELIRQTIYGPGPDPETETIDGILLRSARDEMGFLKDYEVKRIASDPEHRLFLLLVRCGACRFLAPAQDVEHLERCIAAGGDYVRDVSIPVDGCERIRKTGRVDV